MKREEAGWDGMETFQQQESAGLGGAGRRKKYRLMARNAT
jgi:hypothetical protein